MVGVINNYIIMVQLKTQNFWLLIKPHYAKRRLFEMPYVNVKVTPDGLTTKSKKKVIASITELLRSELGKNPETTLVIIETIETDNWGISGQTVTERRESIEQW